MTVAAGVKPQETRQEEAQQHQPERRVDLRGRYGAIGISAVAAAARYAGDTKNDAYAPVDHRIDERFIEAAAT